MRVNKSKERRLKIQHIQRQLNMIDLERQFKWKTPKYQQEHIELLNSLEDKLTKQLEKIL